MSHPCLYLYCHYIIKPKTPKKYLKKKKGYLTNSGYQMKSTVWKTSQWGETTPWIHTLSSHVDTHSTVVHKAQTVNRHRETENAARLQHENKIPFVFLCYVLCFFHFTFYIFPLLLVAWRLKATKHRTLLLNGKSQLYITYMPIMSTLLLSFCTASPPQIWHVSDFCVHN